MTFYYRKHLKWNGSETHTQIQNINDENNCKYVTRILKY